MESKLATQAPQEDFYRALFERSPIGVLVADDQGRYVDANAEGCRMFGVARSELLGKKVFDFVDPSNVIQTHQKWIDFRETKAQTGEFHLRRMNGEIRVLRYRALADMMPGVNVSFLEDITELRAARGDLEQSEKMFREMADGLPILIWTASPDGKIEYLNRRWYEYAGLEIAKKGPFPDIDWSQYIHPEDFSRIMPILSEAYLQGKPADLMYRLKRKDGTYRWQISRSVPIRDFSGKVTKRLGSAADIEDQKNLNESLLAERELRERFVATLSHDLRTPLAASRIGAQMILRTPNLPIPTRNQAESMIRSLDRAFAMIQNLLDANQIRAGEPLHLELQDGCDLMQLLRDRVNDLTTLHGERIVILGTEVSKIRCDRSAIGRVIDNLVDNAVKYGDLSQAPIKISVRGEGSSVLIEVNNQGPPIAAEKLNRLFDPYYRVGSAEASPATKGWGLGLTLVRGMIEAHGGTVQVSSSPGEGTTFKIRIPR